MRGGVVRADRLIEPGADDPPVDRDDGTNRHFTGSGRPPRLRERQVHELFVGHKAEIVAACRTTALLA